VKQTSWMTTIASLVSTFGSFVLFSSQTSMIVWPTWALAVAMFMSIGGLAVFGIVSKDYNVSGGPRGLTGKTGLTGADAQPVEITVEVGNKGDLKKP
jgi:hypothetical protein